MADREKVISWLEGLAEDDWRECYSDSEVQETAIQALDLIDELLKEQETVEPITEYHLFLCPVCKNTLFREQKFCHECGKRIEWEGWRSE